jgi:hypothetical protein
MSPPKALLGSLIVVLAGSPPATAADITSQQRLAGRFTHTAAALLGTQVLSVQALDTAILLASEAASLESSPEAWRLLLELADLAERGDVRRTALAQLVKLDRYDDVDRLLYINDAIEQYQTAEERIAAYGKLLDEKNRAALGPAVVSRLAHDFAILLDRCGDVDGFSRWLAEAVAVDPSNRVAAATAAGFFRMNVKDPFAEAELLTSILLADPTDPESQAVLAELLLEHGAYAGAARLYDLARRTLVAMREVPSSGLIADGVVARWATGDAQGALDVLRQHQRRSDENYRRAARRDNPKLTPLELARLHAPMTSTMAIVGAAIHNSLGDEQAGSALDAAISAYEVEIDAIRNEESPDRAELAARCLEAAFVELALGGNVERASAFLKIADEHLGAEGLSPEARARFEGWITLRRGDAASAVELLASVAQRDSAARLGLAQARRRLGELRPAARDLYEVFKERPGTVMGVWARHELAELVGQRVSGGETAVRLETLAASIPVVIDRFPEDPTLMVSVRLTPAKATFDPFEPVIVHVEVTNHAPIPLAIDRNGPIPSQILLDFSAEIARDPNAGEVRPLIVDIDRRLRLEPNERLIVPVDLRMSGVGQRLNAMPLQGVTMKVRAVIGFRVAGPGVFRPGRTGSEVESTPIRVNGLRLKEGWVEDSIAAILEPDSPQELETFALLGSVLSALDRIAMGDESARFAALEEFENPRQLSADAASAMAEAYTNLGAESRAWLLSVIPRGPPSLAPLFAIAQKDDHRLVRLSYLLYCLTSEDDPMIDAAKRGDDPKVQAVAEMMQQRIAALRSPP